MKNLSKRNISLINKLVVDTVKIKKITVKNLFGMFNHEIPLNLEEHITIIHGPNGFGKTVMLTLLEAVFNLNYLEILSIPFSEFIIDFNNKSKLRLKKTDVSRTDRRSKVKHGYSLQFEFEKSDKKFKPYKFESIRKEDLDFPISMLEHEIPWLERIGSRSWVDVRTHEKLSLEEVLENYRDELPTQIFKEKREPKWLITIKNGVNIQFIEAQRLLTFSDSHRHHPRIVYSETPPMIPAVTNYSEELSNAIQKKLAEYATLSQSLDSTFPTRLVKGNGFSEMTIEEISDSLDKLDKKRSRLMTAGLLDKSEGMDLKELQKIEKSNINVLSVYIADVKEKLRVFDELHNKINLLVKIINNRFLYKEMSISKKDGFEFKTYNNNNLSASNLSSGEQQEIVLLYELLFKVKPNSIILIDEPELSLHVVWQKQFLKDLAEIAKLIGFDVLIATHSPHIIHDRWDLTVELKGPKIASNSA